MKDSFKEQLLPLISRFLFEDNCIKIDVLEETFELIKHNCTNQEMLLINNIRNAYTRDQEISNFCSTKDIRNGKVLIPMFALILSILSLPE